nr:MAG TPA: hypothetical protein [Caudoviricetes sp.]
MKNIKLCILTLGKMLMLEYTIDLLCLEIDFIVCQ